MMRERTFTINEPTYMAKVRVGDTLFRRGDTGITAAGATGIVSIRRCGIIA